MSSFSFQPTKQQFPTNNYLEVAHLDFVLDTIQGFRLKQH